MEPNPYSPPAISTESDPPLMAQLAINGEGMSVEFEQTMIDVMTFQEFFYRPALTRLSVLSLIGIVIAMAAAAIIGINAFRRQTFHSIEPVTYVGAGGLFFGVLFGIRKWQYRRIMLRTYSKGRNLSVFGPRRLTITPTVLMSSAPYLQSVQRWEGIEKVVADKHAIYIFNSSMTAHILPRRAFNSERHFQEFAAKAAEYCAAAR
ncbi:YcxB family protein [Anatilimnocola sp. NA78]|uniref:YcxB family protein n=1 Tax=Anatilimnocola sp. NA78 TaxID=3415683 RepID=UPI003CE585D5